jgi:hypothetical protein
MEKMLQMNMQDEGKDEKESEIDSSSDQIKLGLEAEPSCAETASKSSKKECAFSQGSSQKFNLAAGTTDSTKKITKCPYAHLAVDPKSHKKCPFTNESNLNEASKMDKEAINIAKSASVDITDSKKCPFRCPFVFDSYPLNEDFMRASEEEALREEQVISLFWAKVTSLLHAAALANILDIKKVPSRLHLAEEIDYGRIFMLHTACSSPCPFSVVRLCLELYPEQLMEKDSSGKLPLHHAALRFMDPRELTPIQNDRSEADLSNIFFQRQNNEINDEGDNDDDDDDDNDDEPVLPSFDISSLQQSKNNVIEGEAVKVLDLLMASSPTTATKTFDSDGRLPLHCYIETLIKSVVQYEASSRDSAQRILSNDRVFLRNTRNEFSLMLNPGRWVLQASIQSTTVRNEKGATASSVSTSMDILEKASGLSYLLVSWKKLG